MRKKIGLKGAKNMANAEAKAENLYYDTEIAETNFDIIFFKATFGEIIEIGNESSLSVDLLPHKKKPSKINKSLEEIRSNYLANEDHFMQSVESATIRRFTLTRD